MREEIVKRRDGKYVVNCAFCGKELLRGADDTMRHFCDSQCHKRWKEEKRMNEKRLRYVDYDSQMKISKDAMDARIHGVSYGYWMANKWRMI